MVKVGRAGRGEAKKVMNATKGREIESEMPVNLFGHIFFLV